MVICTLLELAARNLTESSPLDLDRAMMNRIAKAKDVNAVFPVVYSAGILGHEEFEDGIALRGVDQEDALQAIKDYIIEGDTLRYPIVYGKMAFFCLKSAVNGLMLRLAIR